MNADNKGIVKAELILVKLKELLLINQLGAEIRDKDIELIIASKLDPELCDLSILKIIVEKLESLKKL